mmetsp:Transcript_24024/g.62428  ORF Transcript_24024/g.62428 Transcript_24024/m.62428 type:complete len:161 (-) Transcript_24024:161-643(-)
MMQQQQPGSWSAPLGQQTVPVPQGGFNPAVLQMHLLQMQMAQQMAAQSQQVRQLGVQPQFSMPPQPQFAGTYHQQQQQQPGGGPPQQVQPQKAHAQPLPNPPPVSNPGSSAAPPSTLPAHLPWSEAERAVLPTLAEVERQAIIELKEDISELRKELTHGR